jgi:hypothetical protein
MFIFQGLATATVAQTLLKKKTELVIDAQNINNVLQDTNACQLSYGKQNIYYSNGQIAYTAGTVNNILGSFVWAMQGTTTVLTIQPANPMFKPVTLNLNCTVTPTGVPTTVPTGMPTNVATATPTSMPTVIPTSLPTSTPTPVSGLDNGNHNGKLK